MATMTGAFLAPPSSVGLNATTRSRRTLSDITKFDCQCGHDDCKTILDKKASAGQQTNDDGFPADKDTNISIAIPLSPSPKHVQLASDTAAAIPGMHVQRFNLNDPRSIPVIASRGAVALKRVFFSPHPDDVAYSCFGLVSASKSKRMSISHGSGGSSSCCGGDYEETASSFGSPASTKRSSCSSAASSLFEDSLLAAPTPSHRHHAEDKQHDMLDMSDSLIVTVFSKSRCANGQIGRSLRHCVKETTNMRTREDHQFACSVGANLVSLNMADTSARDENSRRPDLLASARNTFASPAAQLLSVDHPSYAEAKRRIKPFVELAVERSATIHIPVAVGCHIDHWMVRVAVLSCLVEIEQHAQWAKWRAAQHDFANSPPQARRGSIYAPPPLPPSKSGQGSRLVFYEDLPYAFIGTDDMVQRTVSDFLPRNIETQLVPMTDAGWARKRAAVEAYASQMKPTLLSMLQDHARLLAKRAATLDTRWQGAPATWTMAERSWVLSNVCGPDANLLTSLASNKSEERGNATTDVAGSRKSSIVSTTITPPSPIRTSALGLTFTSPFTMSSSPLQPLIHIDDADDDDLSDNDDDDDGLSSVSTSTPTNEASDVASPLLNVTARPRLRRMSTCPPSAFPIPYHSATASS